MATLYTTEEILSSIYYDEDNKYTVWYDFIMKLSPNLKVVVNSRSDYEDNNNNPIFLIQHDLGRLPDIDCFDETDGNIILKHIVDMHKSELSGSNAIIILNISEEEARRITDTYGIICHSFFANPVANPLFKEAIEKNVEENEQPIGWRALFGLNREVPSNSLVFVDRYLFANDRTITSQDGIDNVYDILNNVLPKSLGVDYHILIIFDATTLKSTEGDTFQRISTQLNKLTKRLNRPYRIIIETLSLDRNTQYYNETHNRRILSNYFILRVDRSLKAFRNNQSLYSQSLWLDCIASKGIVHQTASDIPAKELSKYLNNIRKAVKQIKTIKGQVLFSQNGNSKIPVDNITNRLLK